MLETCREVGVLQCLSTGVCNVQGQDDSLLDNNKVKRTFLIHWIMYNYFQSGVCMAPSAQLAHKRRPWVGDVLRVQWQKENGETLIPLLCILQRAFYKRCTELCCVRFGESRAVNVTIKPKVVKSLCIMFQLLRTKGKKKGLNNRNFRNKHFRSVQSKTWNLIWQSLNLASFTPVMSVLK